MTEPQGKQESSSPATAVPSLKFQLPEMQELDVYVVELADGSRVVRTAAELEAMGLRPGSEEPKGV